MQATDWNFPTLAYVWEYRTGAIVAGGDRLDALSGADRERSLEALTERVRTMAADLDDGWLVMAAFWMVEDVYKAFFRGFAWSPGVHDYLVATGGVLVHELTRRGFALHYVIDATEGDADLAQTLAYLPAVFHAVGLAVIGPQLVAARVRAESHPEPPADIAEIKPYREQGHQIADEIIADWYRERRSTVYLNMDFDDDSPGLALDAALSAGDDPAAIVVFRNQLPAEGSDAHFRPPAGVTLPPGLPGRRMD